MFFYEPFIALYEAIIALYSHLETIETKIHSFLKQCLCNLHFIKTRCFSRNLSIVVVYKYVPCFDKLKVMLNIS